MKNAVMLSSDVAFESLKLLTFSENDLKTVNNILHDTCAVNVEIILSLRKILERTTIASNSAAGVKGVTCVLNCLQKICQDDYRCYWEEMHLDFAMLVRLCINFVTIVTNNSDEFHSLCSKVMDLMKISYKKHELVKSSMVKVLSQPIIELLLNNGLAILERIHFVQLFNTILAESSRPLRNEIAQVIRCHLSRLPKLLLTCGDYEFQTSIVELVFRFISINANRQSLCGWFKEHPEIQNAFITTPFKDFDPECRTFLNVVNPSLGSRQQVFTFPCSRAFLGNKELFKPKDASYKEFWVDFNMGSNSVSVLCDRCDVPDGKLWEVVSIPCSLVKRISLNNGRTAKTLTLEMTDTRQEEYYQYLLLAEKVKIVFEESTAITSLVEKVLPALFGEVFEGASAAGKDTSALRTTQSSVYKRNRRIGSSGVMSVNSSSHLIKYNPLHIVKSPKNVGAVHNRERHSGRTEFVACLSTKNEKCLQDVVQVNTDSQTPDSTENLKEILRAHSTENTKKIPASSVIISPQLSYISEEKLSQASAVLNASPFLETSNLDRNLVLSKSVGNESFPNVGRGIMVQHAEVGGGKEIIGRYSESSLYCNKETESVDWRCRPVAKVHKTRICGINSNIARSKCSSTPSITSAQDECDEAMKEAKSKKPNTVTSAHQVKQKDAKKKCSQSNVQFPTTRTREEPGMSSSVCSKNISSEFQQIENIHSTKIVPLDGSTEEPKVSPLQNSVEKYSDIFKKSSTRTSVSDFKKREKMETSTESSACEEQHSLSKNSGHDVSYVDEYPQSSNTIAVGSFNREQAEISHSEKSSSQTIKQISAKNNYINKKAVTYQQKIQPVFEHSATNGADVNQYQNCNNLCADFKDRSKTVCNIKDVEVTSVENVMISKTVVRKIIPDKVKNTILNPRKETGKEVESGKHFVENNQYFLKHGQTTNSGKEVEKSVRSNVELSSKQTSLTKKSRNWRNKLQEQNKSSVSFQGTLPSRILMKKSKILSNKHEVGIRSSDSADLEGQALAKVTPSNRSQESGMEPVSVISENIPSSLRDEEQTAPKTQTNRQKSGKNITAKNVDSSALRNMKKSKLSQNMYNLNQCNESLVIDTEQSLADDLVTTGMEATGKSQEERWIGSKQLDKKVVSRNLKRSSISDTATECQMAECANEIQSSNVTERHYSCEDHQFTLETSSCIPPLDTDNQQLTLASDDNCLRKKVDVKFPGPVVSEKCGQGSITLARLAPTTLQQLINDWSSDVEQAGSDQQLSCGVTGPTTPLVAQRCSEERASNEMKDSYEVVRNSALILNEELCTHQRLPSSHGSTHCQHLNTDKNSSVVRNNEPKLGKDLKLKSAVLNSVDIEKVNVTKVAKPYYELRNKKADSAQSLNQNQEQACSMSTTKNVLSPHRLDQLPNDQKQTSTNTKTPSLKRKLYSDCNSPEIVEWEDCDDSSRDPSWSPNPLSKAPSKWRRKRLSPLRKVNVIEAGKKSKTGYRQRRKGNHLSTCNKANQQEKTNSDVVGAQPPGSSVRSFSGRWQSKYLAKVTSEKTLIERVKHPTYHSVYSDIETDSDSVLSWFETKKPKGLVVQKPKITYEKKNRQIFPSKQRKKQSKEVSNVNAKHKSCAKNKRVDPPLVAHSVVSQQSECDVFRNVDEKQMEEMSPVEFDILPHENAEKSESRLLHPLIVEVDNKKSLKYPMEESFLTQKSSVESASNDRILPVPHRSPEVSVNRQKKHLPDVTDLDTHFRVDGVEKIPPFRKKSESTRVKNMFSQGMERQDCNRQISILTVNSAITVISKQQNYDPSSLLRKSCIIGEHNNDAEAHLYDTDYCQMEPHDEFEEFVEQFSQSLKEEAKLYENLKCDDTVAVKSDRLDGQRKNKNKLCINKSKKPVSVLSDNIEDFAACMKLSSPSRLPSSPLYSVAVTNPHLPFTMGEEHYTSLMTSPLLEGDDLHVSSGYGASHCEKRKFCESSLSTKRNAMLGCPSSSSLVPSSSSNIPLFPAENQVAVSPISVLSQRKAQRSKFRSVLQEYTALPHKSDALSLGKVPKKKSRNVGKKNDAGVVVQQKTNELVHAIGSETTEDTQNGALPMPPESSSGLVTLTENSADLMFTVTTPWTAVKRDFMRDFIQDSGEMIEENFKKTCLKDGERRKLLVSDYLANTKSELKKIERNIEQLNQQEERLHKLEKYIKHSFRLQHECFDEISESKSGFSKCHRSFNEDWHLLQTQQHRESGDLREQLRQLLRSRMKEESHNEMTRLGVQLRAMLSNIGEGD